MNDPRDPAPHCPLPFSGGERITLAHGGGGALMHDLVREVFAAAFGSQPEHDGAIVPVTGTRIAMTTDAFVVHPLFYPGGDIGTLAVHGTVNDLAMCGARPLALTASFIIEEGFAVADLQRIVSSMAIAAHDVGVAIVTGDTKVVERGRGDGLYIGMSGIGACDHTLDIRPTAIRASDVLLLNGDVGRHGTAVMCARESLTTDQPIETDCASLWPAVAALLGAGIEVHCLRDLTRGGLATGTVELAQGARLDIELDETAITATPSVQAVCELFGLDPLYVANEGRFVVVLPETQASQALAVLRKAPACEAACIVGRVAPSGVGRVRLRTRFGTLRHVMMLSGEQLPRIC